MSHRPNLALALGAALLAGVPGAVRAQTAPPPPGLPGVPGAPPAPGNPPSPVYPPAPIPPGGGGSLGPGIPPPPPPPPAPPQEAPNAPGLPAGPGLAPVGPATPDMQAPPGIAAPPPPAPDGTPATPGAVTLRYKFGLGQTTRYTLTADVDGTVQAGAATVPIKEHISMGLHQTVKDLRASDGAATLAVQIDTVSMTMTMNGQTVPLPPQAQQQMKQTATLVMSPAGKVLSYQAAAGTTGMSGMGMNPTDMQNIQSALPDKAVAQGDTWRSSFTSAAVGLTTYAAYTLDRLSSDGATATIHQKLYGEFKPAKPGAAGAAPAPKMSGLMTGTGTEQFDIGAGQVAGQTADMQLKLTVTPPNSATSARTEFHITTDMERVTGATATAPGPATEPPTGQLQ